MSFRKEVREFISECREHKKKKNGIVALLKEQIVRLEDQNKDLMNRLMARDLPELTTFTLPEIENKKEVYKPEEDEALAGEVVNIT